MIYAIKTNNVRLKNNSTDKEGLSEAISHFDKGMNKEEGNP